MRRLVYTGYYLKQMNWNLLKKFMDHVEDQYHINRLQQWWLMIFNTLRFNISLLEFFQFRFFEKNQEEKLHWAGTGYMYEYQKKMNPPERRDILDDKRKFLKAYRKFVIHQHLNIQELNNDASAVLKLLSNPSGKIVFKAADGKCGAQVDIRNTADFSASSIVPWMNRNGFDLVEEFIIQHPDLNRLSPSAVNTVRIFTQLDSNNSVDILGCRLRISVNSKVDNMAAGNLAASINELTGIVDGPGVYSDITKVDEDIHPVSGIPITGFKVPFWNQIIEMVKEAARMYPENRSIGWDIVVSEKGPGLIEGNHDWCKLLWQLPVKQGLKHRLDHYSNES